MKGTTAMHPLSAVADRGRAPRRPMYKGAHMKPIRYILAICMSATAGGHTFRLCPADYRHARYADRHDNGRRTICSEHRAAVRRRDQHGRPELEVVLAAARRAAQGRAQRPSHHDGRPGLRHLEHVRRRDPDADAGPGCEGRTSLHAVPLRFAVLAVASGTAHGTQPSRRGIRCDCRAGHRAIRDTTPSSGATTRPSARS